MFINRSFANLFLLFIVFIISFPSQSSGEKYKFQEGESIKLGYGFNPLNPFSGAGSTCYKFKIEPEEPIVNSIYSNVEIISNENSYSKFTNTNGKASLRYGLFSGDVEIKYNSEYVENSNTLFMVAYSEISTLPQGIINLDTITGLNLKTTINKCGPEIVSSITRKARLSILFKFTTSSASAKRSLESDLVTSYMNNSLSVDFSNEIKKFDSSITFSVETYQTGVAGLSKVKVSNLLKVNPGDWNALKDTMSNILENLRANGNKLENLPIDYFSTRSVESLYGQDPARREARQRNISRLLDDIAEKINRTNRTIELVQFLNKKNDLQISVQLGDKTIDNPNEFIIYLKDLKYNLFVKSNNLISSKNEDVTSKPSDFPTAPRFIADSKFLKPLVSYESSWWFEIKTHGIKEGKANFRAFVRPNVSLKFRSQITGITVYRTKDSLREVKREFRPHELDQIRAGVEFSFLFSEREGWNDKKCDWTRGVDDIFYGCKNRYLEELKNEFFDKYSVYDYEIEVQYGEIGSVVVGIGKVTDR